jgi:hypothetical protein
LFDLLTQTTGGENMATDPAKLLKKYQDEGYNILTPAITLEGLSKYHKATVETVSLSPDPDYGDVYKDRNSKNAFIVKKQGLDKLAVLAGILWPDQTGSRRVDDKKDPNYIAFEAFGAIRKSDGQLVPVKAYYDMDLIAHEDDLVHSYREKGQKGDYAKHGKELEEYVAYCVGRDMRQIRKHRAARCESGARNRVIRALLGLKNKYTKVELQKPFVAVRITYQPDYDDPEVKRIVTMMSLGAQSTIFGMNTPPLQLPGTPPKDTYNGDAEVVEANGVETEVETEDDDTSEEGNDSPADDAEFGLWDTKSQITHIGTLAKSKGYDLESLVKRMGKNNLSDMTDIELLKIKDHLDLLKDKPEDDDIPF